VVAGRGNTGGNLTLLALPGPFISYDFLFIISWHFTVYIYNIYTLVACTQDYYLYTRANMAHLQPPSTDDIQRLTCVTAPIHFCWKVLRGENEKQKSDVIQVIKFD